MLCSVCRTQNMDTAKFCGHCGHPFLPDAETPNGLVRCLKGHAYNPTHAMCPYCMAHQVSKFIDFSSPAARRLDLSPTESGVQSPLPNFGRAVSRWEEYAAWNEVAPAGGTEAGDGTNAAEAWEFEPPTLAEQQRLGWESVLTFPSFEEPLDQPEADDNAAPAEAAEPAGGKLVGWLVTFTRRAGGEDYRLRAGRTVLGAHPRCDIILDDPEVSGIHASIVFDGDACYIKNEFARNDLFVNGEKVCEQHSLSNYDEIKLGQMVFRFIAISQLPCAGQEPCA